MAFWNKKTEEGELNNVVSAKADDLAATSSTPSEPSKLAPSAPNSSNPPVPSELKSQASEKESDFSQNLSKVRSALSAGTVIQGKLSFDTPVRIDGKLSGEVYSSKPLIIGETALIEAQIEASVLVIMGKVKGNVKVSEKVQLCSGAVFEGIINSPSLVIESGATFNGSCEMKTASTKASKEAVVSNKSSVLPGKTTDIFTPDSVDLEDVLEDRSKKAPTVAIQQP